MPTLAILLSFAVAVTILAVTPGPSVVLLLAVGTDSGAATARWTALGLALGTAVWSGVAALGMAAVLASQPDVLTAVTLVGAAYLLWLAVRTLRPRAPTATEVDAPLATGSATAFRDGAVVNLLNPSIALFLAAITPPFLDPSGPPVGAQLGWLGAVLVVVSTIVNLGWAGIGAGIGARARAWAGDGRTRVAVAITYVALATAAVVTALP